MTCTQRRAVASASCRPHRCPAASSAKTVSTSKNGLLGPEVNDVIAAGHRMSVKWMKFVNCAVNRGAEPTEYRMTIADST